MQRRLFIVVYIDRHSHMLKRVQCDSSHVSGAGELAAERERNAPATHCKPADSSSMHRTGVVAVCLSPAAAKSRQDQMAAGPAARQAVPMPAVETPHQCKVGDAICTSILLQMMW